MNEVVQRDEPTTSKRNHIRKLSSVSDAKTGEKTSKLVPIFVFSLAIPLFVHVGTVRIAPFLLVLIIAFFPCLFKLLRGGAGKINSVDLCFIATAIWQCIALLVSGSLGEVIQPLGIVVLQTLGAYMLGRTTVRSKEAFLTVVKCQLTLIFVMFPFALIETLTSVPLYLNVFRVAGPVFENVIMEARLGLDRVQAAFEHPILYGMFCASGFSLAYFGLRKSKPALMRYLASFTIMISCFISLSTGALLALTTQLGVIGWGRVFRSLKSRWKVLGFLVSSLYIAVDILSNRTPFHVFVDYMTFNQGSAYNRILIWQFGTAEVARNPFFGLGIHHEQWERPWYMSPSMDNFWLVIASRYGLPALIFLVGGFLLFLFKAGARRELDERVADFRIGIIIAVVGVFFGISSVHLWNASFCWFIFLLGSGVWMLEQGRSAKEVETEQRQLRREAAETARQETRRRRLSESDPS